MDEEKAGVGFVGSRDEFTHKPSFFKVVCIILR
jgi:hypothetical protein